MCVASVLESDHLANYPEMAPGGNVPFREENESAFGACSETDIGSYTRLLICGLASPNERSERPYDPDGVRMRNDGFGGTDIGSKTEATCKRRGETLKRKYPPGAMGKKTASRKAFFEQEYDTMRLNTLSIPDGRYVVESMNQFARANSKPGVALCFLGGSGAVRNLKLEGPWKNDIRVEGNAEIVTISRTFQTDWAGTLNSTSLAMMVSNDSGNLFGGTVEGDMQAVGPVTLTAYLFMI